VRQRGACRQSKGDRDEERASCGGDHVCPHRRAGPVRPSVKHR
jgi:hypothetical protein